MLREYFHRVPSLAAARHAALANQLADDYRSRLTFDDAAEATGDDATFLQELFLALREQQGRQL